MNPLSIPFAQKLKKPLADPVPNFLGVRNEAVRDSESAKVKIKIQVIGVKGLTNATYAVEYVEGQPLKCYLDALKLKQAAIRSAVRDLSDLSRGRLRMRYIPTERSHITLGSASVSSAMEYQRTSVDAQSVARRMGSDGKGPPPNEVVVRLAR